jgi:hypothetical protein
VRSAGVSRRFAYGFRTDLYFVDARPVIHTTAPIGVKRGEFLEENGLIYDYRQDFSVSVDSDCGLGLTLKV